ncbi:MAG TPA: glycosyltransferase [Longimicrobiales bacterium]|nr:glycosyltransferase [Longimicrobiales bacterium]
MSEENRKPVLPDVSVVIPTLGRPILEGSLAAIEAGSRWPAAVVVVDQGQSEEVARMARAFSDRGLNVVHVPSAERGRARGVNRGIERIDTRFFAVTDDDCFAEGRWVEALTLRLREEPGAIVTGRVEAPEGGHLAFTVRSRDGFMQRKPRLTFDSLSGGNMAAARQLIVDLGMLDEAEYVKTAEDGELAYRALRAGIPLVFEPEAGVLHMDWRDEAQRAVQYGSYARSHGGFYGKYLRRGDLFIALRFAVHWTRAARRWLRGTLTGNRSQAEIGRAYALGLVGGVVTGWKQSAALVEGVHDPKAPRSSS